MNRQDLFKTVPNYMGETKYGKCGAGFNARLGGGISIAKGETAAEILANAEKVLGIQVIQDLPPTIRRLAEKYYREQHPNGNPDEFEDANDFLTGGFAWARTAIGWEFWDDVNAASSWGEERRLQELEEQAKKFIKTKKKK
jgi:hypothetical protein